MGFLKSVGTVFIYIGFFLAVITFIPGLPPEATFSEYSIQLPTKTAGGLKLQNRLKGAEVLFSGDLKGAESFDVFDGQIYTGVHGGYVVSLEENRVVPIVKFGRKCDGIWQEEKCGRPLGLKFDAKGDLYVADAYYGIFRVDVRAGRYKVVVNSSEPIEGKVPRLTNSVDVTRNGDIYWTDSSTEFGVNDGVYTMLTNPSGRLIRYNAATRENQVLLRDLAFPNGVKLSKDESFLLILETLTSRILKYHLKGPRAGQSEIFASALPGLPDNVHADGRNGFLVSLITYADLYHPMLTQSLMPHPYIRKMLVRLLYLMEAPFKLLHDVYPNSCAERLMHSIGSLEGARMLDTMKTSIVLRFDQEGRILDALHSDDGKVHDISSAFPHDGYLWLGSPFNEYIQKVPLEQVFPDMKTPEKIPSSIVDDQKEESKVRRATVNLEAKPVEPTTAKPPVEKVTQKPTTMAPKPTTAPKPTMASKPTTTTPKPTTTTRPAVTKEQTASKTTETKSPKNDAKATRPPPPTTTKESTHKVEKRDDTKARSNVDAKSNTANRANPEESLSKKYKAKVEAKSEEPVKQSIPNTRSEKSKSTGKKDNSRRK